MERGGTGDIHLSDVIEVIQNTDPSFNKLSEDGGGTVDKSKMAEAYVEIVEQPASKAMRFRYECEGRSAGSIPGQNSTPENKTYPTIRVVGYEGKAVVVVSCVTKDKPYKPHPHNLVGKEGCKKGVCTIEVPPDTMTVTFSNLGIRCVKKRDIESALQVREEIRVDPFRTGFQHRNQASSIDLNAVRLCFQVFLSHDGRSFTYPLPPVVSDPIFDKKANCDLAIFQLSTDYSSVAGGQKVLLFCEKVTKDDISVRFYEEKNGQMVWEGFADFQPSDVHRQVGIAFTTPPYKSLEVTDPVKVFIQLYRPSDKACSDPLPFFLTPLESEADMKRKRPQRAGSVTPNNYIRAERLQNTAKAKMTLPPYTSMNIPGTPVKIEKKEPLDPSYKILSGGTWSASPSTLDAIQYHNPLSVSPGPSVASPDMGHLYPYASPNANLMLSPSTDASTPSNSNDGFNVPAPQWNIAPTTMNSPNNDFSDSTPQQMNIPPYIPNNDWIYYDQNHHQNNIEMKSASDSAAGTSNILNLDSKELCETVQDFNLEQINSTDLVNNLGVFDQNQLSESLSNNLNINNGPVEDNNTIENMTDSGLVRYTISELTNLNQMYPKHGST